MDLIKARGENCIKTQFLMKRKNYLEIKKSQLSDLNRVPARYEGAALPGELSWQVDF